MGARTDQAEQRVKQQRELIAHRLESLESRVRDDLQTSKTRTTETVEGAAERMKGLASDVPGASSVVGMVDRHPLVSVLGTFGAGVAMGMLGDGNASAGASRSHNGNGHSGGGGENGGFSRLIDQFSGLAMGSVAGPVRHELESFARDTVKSFFEAARQPAAATSNGSNPYEAQDDPVAPNREPGKA